MFLHMFKEYHLVCTVRLMIDNGVVFIQEILAFYENG